MVRTSLLSWSLVLLVAVPSAADDGWIVLFDGTSLDAWRGYQQETIPETWSIDAEGNLALSQNHEDWQQWRDIVTRQQFGDFELEFEWRVSEGGNSGVIYRVTEDQSHGYKTGPEYQVLDDSASAFEKLKPNQVSASIYGLYARVGSEPKPVGEWNQGRIVLDHGRLEHWLNGVKVAEGVFGSQEWDARVAETKFAEWPRFGKNERGHIELQDHGDPVWYRNLRIRPLNEPAKVGATLPRRLLFVTQSAGYEHSSVTRKPHELSHAERVMQQLGIRSGEFRADCTQDVAAEFTPELVAEYDVVAFYTTGELPIPEPTREWFLDTWLAEEGHGFLGLHSAADTYHEYEPYWDMIGGTFDGHPWNLDATVALAIHDGDHPASRPWGVSGSHYVLQDEIYQFKNWQPTKVRVLMSLDMERTELKKPRHVPVLWVKPYGQGRVMHMSLGHREDVWSNSVYQESLLGGIRWLMGVEQGDATPNPELSGAEEARAIAAVSAVAVPE